MTSRTKRYYLRTERQSARAGSSLTYSFDGTRVSLIGSKGPKRGQAQILLMELIMVQLIFVLGHIAPGVCYGHRRL